MHSGTLFGTSKTVECGRMPFAQQIAHVAACERLQPRNPNGDPTPLGVVSGLENEQLRMRNCEAIAASVCELCAGIPRQMARMTSTRENGQFGAF